MSELLRTDQVSRRFGGIQAVKDCNISVRSGSITGLIGPNGSGKTTLFNLITGLYAPDEGEIFFAGKKITNLSPNIICREGLSRTFQITRLFWEMTVLENMIVPIRQVGIRSLLGPNMFRDEIDRAMRLLERMGLAHLKDEPARKLSFGQQKLLEFAAILMADPVMIMLDEPAGGVNPTMIRFIMKLIQDLNEEGVTFLVVEHNMGVVMELCNHVIVLDQGTKLAEGSCEMIQTNPAVLDAYLGT